MKRQLLENIVPVSAFTPANNDGTAITGDTIDREGYQSAIVVLHFAASTGSPTAPTALFRVEDAAESGFNVTNATWETLETVLDIKTAAIKYYYLDLAQANRYIRVYYDATYSDGSSPKNIVSCEIVLGDKSILPAGSTTIYDGV